MVSEQVSEQVPVEVVVVDPEQVPVEVVVVDPEVVAKTRSHRPSQPKT